MDLKILGSCYVCREKTAYASFQACIRASDYAYGSCLRNMIPNPFPHSIKFTNLINLSIQLFYWEQTKIQQIKSKKSKPISRRAQNLKFTQEQHIIKQSMFINSHIYWLFHLKLYSKQIEYSELKLNKSKKKFLSLQWYKST